MKKLVSIFCLVLISSFGLTAQEKQVVMPKKGDKGVNIVLDGLIDNISFTTEKNTYGNNILFAKYYLEDNKAIRLGFGFNLDRTKRNKADSIGLTLVEKDSTISRFSINVSGGIEKHFAPSNRLDPYIFTQIDLTFVGKRNTKFEQRDISSIGTAKTERDIKEDGGIAVGLLGGVGFNYFFAPKFSIGAEMAMRIQYSSIGGTVSDNTVFTPINGNSTSTFNKKEDKVANTDIDVTPNASIQISYFF